MDEWTISELQEQMGGRVLTARALAEMYLERIETVYRNGPCLNAVIEENVSGQRVVRAFRRNDSAIETFRQHNKAVYKAGLYANTYALLLMPLTNVLGNFFMIVLAGFKSGFPARGENPPSGL